MSTVLKQQLDTPAALDIRPLTGGMGAEIHGVDLSQKMNDATFAAIHQVLLDHGVIFFGE